MSLRTDPGGGLHFTDRDRDSFVVKRTSKPDRLYVETPQDVGNGAHLDRADVAALRDALTKWLDTGKLSDPGLAPEVPLSEVQYTVDAFTDTVEAKVGLVTVKWYGNSGVVQASRTKDLLQLDRDEPRTPVMKVFTDMVRKWATSAEQTEARDAKPKG